jgi:serine protease Do
VLIKDVVPGSPAATAGIRTGDVILTVGGHDVADPDELHFRVATLTSDASVRLEIWRAGKRREFDAALSPPPEMPPRQITKLRGQEPFAGATVGNLNPAFAEELGIDSGLRGVVVRDVAPDSVAAQLGIEPGDLVVCVNDRTIASVAELQRAVAADPPWRVTIQRGDHRISVTIGG